MGLKRLLLPFNQSADVPGTELLVDLDHSRKTAHSSDGSDIILIPTPTACEGDPLRWGKWKKYWHLSLVCLYACIFSFAENNTGDAWSEIVAMTHSTMAIMNGGGALNYLMLGLVNIFWIPTAMKIGRRFCFLLTLLLCTASAIWMAVFHTVGEWYGSNVFNGLGTSAYEAVIQLVIFDIFFIHESGRMLGAYISAQQVGSIIGLVAGGYIADGPGWRWSQWIVVIGEGFLIFLFFFTFEETLFPRFLFPSNLPTTSGVVPNATLPADKGGSIQIEGEKENAEKKAEAETQMDELPVQTDVDVPPPEAFPKRTYKQMLALWTFYPQDSTTYWQYFKRPFFLVKFPNIVIAGVLFAFGCTSGIVTNNTLSEILTASPYHFSAGTTGLIYISALVGNVIGFLTGSLSDFVVISLARHNNGVKEPEMRLWTLVLCFFYTGLGYMIYGWGAQEGAHWITIAIGIASMIAQQVACTSTATAYAMDCFPGIGGEIVVVLAVCSSIINFAISESCQYFVQAVGYGWVFFFYGIIILLALTSGGVLYFKGKMWRSMNSPRYYRFLIEKEGGSI